MYDQEQEKTITKKIQLAFLQIFQSQHFVTPTQTLTQDSLALTKCPKIRSEGTLFFDENPCIKNHL